MRVTNMMTSNQLLLNLNKTMTSLSFLQYQSETGNKIRYASDNPIIAGRSLKFRTNIVETEQYISNVDQGRSWLKTTANATKNVLEALVNSGENSIRSLLVSAGGTNTVSDSKIYANQLSETLKEILAELNGSYAGRYIYSGFKTDERPVFDTDNPGKQMVINQSFSIKDIQENYKVYAKPEQLPATVPPTIDVTGMPTEVECCRLKLAYDVGIDPSTIGGFAPGVTIKTVNSTDPEAYMPEDGEINFIEDTGELIFAKDVYDDMKADVENSKAAAESAVKAVTTSLQAADKNNTYQGAIDAKDAAFAAIVAIQSLIGTAKSALNPDSYKKMTDANDAAWAAFNDAEAVVDAYDALNANPTSVPLQKALQEARYQAKQTAQASYDSTGRAANAATNVDVTYTKMGFTAGELNPKVYFECMETDGSRKYDMYNQSIMYEFGINNKMPINTLAKDLLTTGLMNDIKDVVNLIDGITISDEDELIKKFMSPAGGGLSYEEAQERAKVQIEDEDKFYTDMIGNACTKLIGKVDKHSTQISKENTSIGSRLSRLDLVYNRLQDDRLNYEDLKSENDNVDAAEAYIRLQSMLSVYQSALQTGSKVIQMSLVNFI